MCHWGQKGFTFILRNVNIYMHCENSCKYLEIGRIVKMKMRRSNQPTNQL